MPGSADGKVPSIYHKLDRHFPLTEIARATGTNPPARASSRASQSSSASGNDDSRSSLRDDRRSENRDDRRFESRDERRTVHRDERRTENRDDRRAEYREERRADYRDDRRAEYREERRAENRDERRAEVRDDRRGKHRDERRSESRGDRRPHFRDDRESEFRDDHRLGTADDYRVDYNEQDRSESRDDRRSENRDDRRFESRDDRRSEHRDDRRAEYREDRRGKHRGERKSDSRSDRRAGVRDDRESEFRDERRFETGDDYRFDSREEDRSELRDDRRSESRDDGRSKVRNDRRERARDDGRSKREEGRSKAREDKRSGSREGQRRLFAPVPAPRAERRPSPSPEDGVGRAGGVGVAVGNGTEVQPARRDVGMGGGRGGAGGEMQEPETFVAEQFQLGRPGEFEGPFGTEHVGHPPRAAPLELPFVAPGLAYSRTTQYLVYGGGTSGSAAGKILVLVDERDGHVALELRSTAEAADGTHCGGVGVGGGGSSAVGLSSHSVGNVVDSMGNVLLTLCARFATVPAAVEGYGYRDQRAHETRFMVVVANHWGEPLLSVVSSGPVASAEGAAEPHLVPYTQRARSQPIGSYGHSPGRFGGRGGPDHMLDHPGLDAAYAQRIAANNFATGFHDRPGYDDYGRVAAPPSHSAPAFPEDIRYRFSEMNVSNGRSGSVSSGSSGGLGATDTVILPEVDAFAGELDAPNRPVESRPVMSLISSHNSAQSGRNGTESIRSEHGDELAVVGLAPQRRQGGQTAKLSLVLHPGVDVTLVTALLAARMWLAYEKFPDSIRR